MDSEVFAWLAFFGFVAALLVGAYFFTIGWAMRSSYKHTMEHIANHNKNDPCSGFLG